MTDQETLLNTLTDVLVCLVTNAGGTTTREVAYQYVQTFYAALMFQQDEQVNKVQWIKALRERFSVPGKKTINLRYTPGTNMLAALVQSGVRLDRDSDGMCRVWRFGYKSFGLKEAKDFVDFMIDCVMQMRDE